MRILLVSTLKRKVTSSETASRSRIIYQLASGLAKAGHNVSLLGTGDSKIPGVTTIPVIDQGWEEKEEAENPFVYDISTLIKQGKHLLTLQEDFDIIHNHTYPDFFPHVLEDQLTVPLVSTLHLQAEPYIDETLSQFNRSYFVAISESAKKLLPKTNVFSVIYNGVDTNLYAYKEAKEDYLFWLGRINGAKNEKGEYLDPKGVRHAIALAEKTGSRLVLGGSVHDKKAFEVDVEPHLNDKVTWVGDVGPKQSLSVEQVVNLMQNAKAFLMTVNWEEPFGLVMAEAMSCGTPVIGFNHGSVTEIVEDGKTGFVVNPENGVEGLSQALDKINTIHPEDCRKRVEENFSIEKMVENYGKVYNEIIEDFKSK